MKIFQLQILNNRMGPFSKCGKTFESEVAFV